MYSLLAFLALGLVFFIILKRMNEPETTYCIKTLKDETPAFSDGKRSVPYLFRFLKDHGIQSDIFIIAISAPYPSIKVLHEAEDIVFKAVHWPQNQYGVYIKTIRMEQLINAYLWEYAVYGKFPKASCQSTSIKPLANKNERCIALMRQKKTFLELLGGHNQVEG